MVANKEMRKYGKKIPSLRMLLEHRSARVGVAEPSLSWVAASMAAVRR